MAEGTCFWNFWLQGRIMCTSKYWDSDKVVFSISILMWTEYHGPVSGLRIVKYFTPIFTYTWFSPWSITFLFVVETIETEGAEKSLLAKKFWGRIMCCCCFQFTYFMIVTSSWGEMNIINHKYNKNLSSCRDKESSKVQIVPLENFIIISSVPLIIVKLGFW